MESELGQAQRLRGKGTRSSLLRNPRMIREIGIPAATVALIIIWTVASPVFLRASNFQNVFRQSSVLAIVCLGLTFVLVCGELDLSVAAIVAASGTFAAMVYRSNDNYLVATVAAIAFGALVGAANGGIVVKFHISSFISTIGMGAVISGVILAVTGGAPISDVSSGFGTLGTGSFGPIPLPILLVALLFALSWAGLERMHWGREIRAVGGNARAAYLAGLRPAWARFLAFVVCGAMAGLAGLLLASRVHSGQPTAAVGLELQAVTAAVLGGVSLYGGRGSLHNAIFGVLFISFLTNGLKLLGVSSFIQQMVVGAALIAAVWMDGALSRRN